MKQGWEIKKLGEVCTFQRGLTYSKDDEVEHSNNCVLRSNNIDLDTMSIVLDELKYINDDFAVSEDKKVKPNTILICMSNGSKQHIGKVAFIDKEYGYAFGGFMGLIRPNAEVSPKFIYYSCISSSYKHFLAGIGNGANITNLKFSDLQQYTLPIPPREEQERIVEELDCLSGVIERKREQLNELDALAQSIFYQMFGDPITNEKGWETRPLKNSVIEMFLGPFGSALKTDCYVSKEDAYCMVYEQKHAIKKTMELETHYIDKDKFESLKRFEVHSGDFIMSCRGTIGEIYRLPNNAPIGIIHPSLMKIRIKEDVYHPTFFIRLLTHIVKNENTNGNCVQMAITAKELGARTPITPPLTLQQQFAEKIGRIEKQKQLIKESIDEMENLFNSRMDYYFN